MTMEYNGWSGVFSAVKDIIRIVGEIQVRSVEYIVSL